MRLSNQIVMGKIVGWTAIGAGIASLVGTSELERKRRLEIVTQGTSWDEPTPHSWRFSDFLENSDLRVSEDTKKRWAWNHARSFLNRLDEQSRQEMIDNGSIEFNGYDFPIRDGVVDFS